MAQRPDRPTGGGRRRTAVAPVKKPFPWGTVLTATVLGLLLVGILVYAVTNQGSGFVDATDRADRSVPGVRVFDEKSRASHVEGTVQYPQTPPVGGSHNGVAQRCQVYAAPIANEHAVHSLEHGAVWVTYRPDLAADQVAALAALVSGDTHRLMSPYPGQSAPISLQAWGRQLTVQKASDPGVKAFLDAYTAGPQAPEQGASCDGTTATGPLQGQAPPASPAPAPASPAASPSATG